MEASVGNFPTKSREAALAEATSGTRQREQEKGLAKQGGDEAGRCQPLAAFGSAMRCVVNVAAAVVVVNMCLCVL